MLMTVRQSRLDKMENVERINKNYSKYIVWIIQRKIKITFFILINTCFENTKYGYHKILNKFFYYL